MIWVCWATSSGLSSKEHLTSWIHFLVWRGDSELLKATCALRSTTSSSSLQNIRHNNTFNWFTTTHHVTSFRSQSRVNTVLLMFDLHVQVQSWAAKISLAAHLTHKLSLDTTMHTNPAVHIYLSRVLWGSSTASSNRHLEVLRQRRHVKVH